MSKRKQAAAEAARLEKDAAKDDVSTRSFWRKAVNPRSLAVIGVGVLLTLSVIGASVGNSTSLSARETASEIFPFSWFAGGRTDTSNSNPPAVAAVPAPKIKEYVYAGNGGRMLAIEENGAAANSVNGSDLVVWRLSTGTWYIRDAQNPNNPWVGIPFGASGDKPVPADFDGDGLYDFCVFRPNDPSTGIGTWYIQPNGGGSFYGVQFGLANDVPAPADYDGDGRADVAVWRSSNATFYILKSETNSVWSVQIGQSGDAPISADYDGDGRADPAVFRTATTNAAWIIRRSTESSVRSTEYGTGGSSADKPVLGDYDGDGKFDLAVRRDSSNTWHYWKSTDGQMTQFTMPVQIQAGDKSVPGDYDADGGTDAAIWRPSNGTWYIRQSSNGQLRQEVWGQAGDEPVPAPFKK